MSSPLSSRLTLDALWRKRATMQPQAPALSGMTPDGPLSLSYGELAERVARLAGALRSAGVQRGDRVAVWSENQLAYIELELAAAHLGAIVACLNWRLSDAEQLHCIALVEPVMMVVSPRYRAALERLDHGVPQVRELGAAWDAWRDAARPAEPETRVEPEDGLVILYTSGTTGLPKGALISHRAMVARAMVFATDYGIRGSDGYICWSPLFHMAATDHALATLLLGGHVMVCDGLVLDRIVDWLAHEEIGWLMAMPGMIEALIDALRGQRIRSVRMVGAMADLVAPAQIAELTALVGAPYLNSFGSTETGLPPASGALLAAGELPRSLSKRESGGCLVRLVDDQDQEVPLGTPGEMTMRGPTLFSGYWANPQANATDFRGGWFHMGDLFVRHANGSLDFVDRLKYLIKSGGENIYPAEVERVLLTHPRVRDAAVVRKPDARWGEVPVAFVACHGEGAAGVDLDDLMAHCRAQLPSYKLPKEIRIVAFEAIPRSSTGKIQRHVLEQNL